MVQQPDHRIDRGAAAHADASTAGPHPRPAYRRTIAITIHLDQPAGTTMHSVTLISLRVRPRTASQVDYITSHPRQRRRTTRAGSPMSAPHPRTAAGPGCAATGADGSAGRRGGAGGRRGARTPRPDAG